jgi:hypothetical protein
MMDGRMVVFLFALSCRSLFQCDLDLDETLKVAGNSSYMENSRTSDHLLMLFDPATVYVDGLFQGRCIVPQLLRPRCVTTIKNSITNSAIYFVYVQILTVSTTMKAL